MILTQAFVIDLLRRKFGDRGAMHASTCAMVSAALGIAASRQCWTYVVFMCLLSMGAVLKATIITAQVRASRCIWPAAHEHALLSV
jgi:hypothetical protein